MLTLIIKREWLRQAKGEFYVTNRVSILYICRVLGSSHLTNHLANEINQGPYYVKYLKLFTAAWSTAYYQLSSKQKGIEKLSDDKNIQPNIIR